ncbi:MAG TPA: response regulator [Solirubrobacterales bacterium]|nr:response regulator [Solirubrobacterales bacterium]
MNQDQVRERPLVLVADDEPDILSLVSLRLREAAYDIASAVDGRQALRVARERRPDAAVIDVWMPEMDGYELTRAIRADTDLRTMPVVLLSASVRESEIHRGEEVGANDYLRKPFVPSELRQAVAAALTADSASTEALR